MKIRKNKRVKPGLMLILVGLEFIIGAGTITHASGDLGIILSNTCLTMIKNNLTTNCPTYQELLTIFPDTSNQQRSGEFKFIDGIYQRDKPAGKNHYEYYRYIKDDILFVDTPPDIQTKVKLITITSRDFIYPLKNQEITNASFQYGQSRFIDKNCQSAIITADNYLFLLGDTMQTLLLNCVEGSSNFDEVKIKKWNATYHDISTSAKWKLEKYIEYIKNNCLREYGSCDDGKTITVKLEDSLVIGESK